MLVLSRKIGESVVLPFNGVTVTVLRVSGSRVRLGVEAPQNTVVHRTEVFRRIEKELAMQESGTVLKEA